MMEIILVEDDPDHRSIIKGRLGEIFEICQVRDFANAAECLTFIDDKGDIPDMVVSDLDLENSMDGIGLFEELKKRKIPSQFVLISSNGKKLHMKKHNLRSGDCYFLKEQFFKASKDIIREKICRSAQFMNSL